MSGAQSSSPTLRFLSKSRRTASGVMVRAHASVRDEAMAKAAEIVDRMLSNMPRVAKRLRQAGAEFHVLAEAHAISELPYLRRFRKLTQDGMSWDERNAMGTAHRLWTSCSECNLLALPSDRFSDHRSIGAHEFAHTVMQCGFSASLRRLIRARHLEATSRGLWATTYAATNDDEFFAELTMWYFGSRGDYGRMQPPPEVGAEWLQRYDAESYRLLDDIYSGRFDASHVRDVDRVELRIAYPPADEFTLRSPPPPPSSPPPPSPLSSSSSLPPSPSPSSPSRNKQRKKRPEKKKAADDDDEFDAENADTRAARFKVELIVVNETATTRAMYWLDSDGRRQERGVVYAGDTCYYLTCVGDPLLIADKETGQGLCVFVPNANSPLQMCRVVELRR